MIENSDSRIKNIRLLKHTWVIILLLFTFTACELLDVEKQVMIEAGEVIDYAPCAASVKGIIFDVGEDGVTQYGHVWSVDTNLSINLTSKTELGSKYSGETFTSKLTGLKPATIYYVKAYASVSSGKTIYSDKISFTTKEPVTDYDQITYSLNTSVLRDEGGDVFTSYDGFWNHENASDQWDGSAIGEGYPGGLNLMDGYYRFQDTGDPRFHGMDDPSNRKVYGYCNLTLLGGNSPTLLDDGATIHFIARLATDGPLDSLYFADGTKGAVPETGDGYLLHNGAVGNFGIKQGEGGLISFVLRTERDLFDGLTGMTDTSNNPFPIYPDLTAVKGLEMNPLNGTLLTTEVNSGQGTPNIIELDPTLWHDFWITIKKDYSGTGTHVVNLSVDGAPPEIFFVTAANTTFFQDKSVLRMGVGMSNQSGAIDIMCFEFAPVIMSIPPY